MLTQSSTKTLRHATAGAELAHYQPAGPLQSSSIDRPAHGLNYRYWIRDLLFSGSQGVVYQAHDISLNRPCSVKMIEPALKNTNTLEQRFQHEAEILSRLSHPNIVEMYECTRDEQGNRFSVMEPLEGRDLGSLLAEVTIVPLAQALEILHAVGAALQHSHDVGIVHQDISPSSIFLHKERRGRALPVEVVKVMNFGRAKELTPGSGDEARNLHLGLVFDSPTYLAPEELELSSEWVDARADQWSLAVLAYQMLSGQLPFWENDPWCLRALIRGAEAPVPLAVLMPELPSCVVYAIQKALSKDKDQRYRSVGDFMRALEGLPTPASRQTKPEVRSDLIEQCRSMGSGDSGDSLDSPLAAVPTPLPVETTTREYPVLGYPAELLASADKALLPEPRLTPPWTGGKVTQRQRGVGRRLWLAGCIVMALAPAPVVAALHYLHAAPHTRALIHQSSPLPAPPPPRPVAAALPSAVAALPLALPAGLGQLPVAHTEKLAQPHHARPRAAMRADPDGLNAAACRDKISQKVDQAALAEGLGL